MRLQISDCRFQISLQIADCRCAARSICNAICDVQSTICNSEILPTYTAAMAFDVSAEVITNRPLSDDYNVLSLAAPSIAAAAAPGQFVMVKAATGHDPLLRRPFSVFEVLRDAAGQPSGISLLNKRIGVSTGL